MKNSVKIDANRYIIKPVSEIKPIPRFSSKRILFIKPSSLGDIFHALPAFYLLKASCPKCHIDWLVNKKFAPILEFIKDDIDGIVYFDRKIFRTRRALQGLIELVSSIRQVRYDLVIDMQGLLRSSLMAFVARSEKRIGFENPKEKLSALMYNEKIKIPKTLLHAIEKNAYLVSKILKIRCAIPDYSLSSIKRYKNSVCRLLEKKKIHFSYYVVLAPGARWETKRWPAQFFSEVADRLCAVQPDLGIILVGDDSEKKIAEEIICQCKRSKPVSFIGKTKIGELVELLRGAKALLTNDSGPMHIAAGLRVPVFALFGPTDPKKTGPFWQWHKVYQNMRGCTKCLKRECKLGTLECQNHISPKKVAGDIIKKLETI